MQSVRMFAVGYYSITNTQLIYNIHDRECLKNAEVLLKYFYAHNKLKELIVWAFKQQIIINSKDDILFSENGIFTILFFIYTKLYSHENINILVKALSQHQDLLDKINIGVLTAEATDRKSKEFSQSLKALIEVVSISLEYRSLFVKASPKSARNTFQPLVQHVKDRVGDSYLNICVDLVLRVFKSEIAVISKDSQFLQQLFGVDFYERNERVLQYILSIISMTLGNERSRVCRSVRNATKSSIHSFINEVVHLVERTEPLELPGIELTDSIVVDMVMLIKANSLPLKKDLKGDVPFKLYEALDFSSSVIDDQQLYDRITHLTQGMMKRYYLELYRLAAVADKKEEEYDEQRQLVENTTMELEEKKRLNAALFERLDQLRSQRGMQLARSDKKLMKSLNLPYEEKKKSLKEVLETIERKRKERKQAFVEAKNKKKDQIKRKRQALKEEWKAQWKSMMSKKSKRDSNNTDVPSSYVEDTSE